MHTLRSLTPSFPTQCLWAHHSAARALAVHASLIVTGEADGALRAYTLDGALVASRIAHTSAVRAVGFVRDAATGASLLLSVGDDRRAVVSDLALATVRAFELPDRPRALATDPRSSLVAIALEDQRVLSCSTDGALVPWPAHTNDACTGLAAIDHGERFVLSTYTALWVTDARGALLRTIDGQRFASDELNSVTVRSHPDGRRVVVDASGEAMRLYSTRDVWALDVDTQESVRIGADAAYATPWMALDAKPIEFVGRPAAATADRHRVLAPGAMVTECLAVDLDTVVVIQQDGSLKRFSLRPVERTAPTAGVFVRGFDRVAGELCTWDRGTRSVHRFSAEDGAWRRSELGKHLENEQLTLCADGTVLAASAPGTPLVAAVIERWNAGDSQSFRADGDYELPRAAAVSSSGERATVVAQFHELHRFSPEESAVFSRDTPHRTWGGVACVREDRVVSYDRLGLVVGWAPDDSAAQFTTRVEPAPCAIAACRDGRSVALLLERASRELELLWLDADTGAVLQRSQRAKAALASTLVEREDGSVVSAGVPPVVFDRASGAARVVDSAVNSYCTMLDASGRYALVQSFEHARSALDVDQNTLRPLPGCEGSPLYSFASLSGADGTRFAVTGLRGEVLLVDPARASVLARKTLHEAGVLALSADRDGARLLSVGADGLTRVWTAETLALESEHPGPKSAAYFARFDDEVDGALARRARVWGYDERAGVGQWEYDLDRDGSSAPRAVVRQREGERSTLPAQRARWSLSTQTRVVRFDVGSGRIDAQVAVPYRHAQRCALSDSGRWLVLTDVVESCVVDLERKVVRALDKSWSLRARFAFDESSSPPSLVAAAGAALRVLSLEDATERSCTQVGEPSAKIERLELAPRALAVLVVASAEGPRAPRWIEARSLEDQSLVWKSELGPSAVTALSVAHGRVAVGDADGRVRVFKITEPAPLASWQTSERIEDLRALEGGRVAVIDGAGQLHVLSE